MACAITAQTYTEMLRRVLFTDKVESNLTVEALQMRTGDAPASTFPDQLIQLPEHKGANSPSLVFEPHFHSTKHEHPSFRTEPDNADNTITLCCGDDGVL